MRLVIISLDLLVALPVLSVAALFLLSSVRGTQGYLLTMGASMGARLNAIVASQQIASEIDANAANYSDAAQIARSISSSHGLMSELLARGETSACGDPSTVCRLVTASGNAYLLVLRYENAG